jgi:hypothetical protein
MPNTVDTARNPSGRRPGNYGLTIAALVATAMSYVCLPIIGAVAGAVLAFLALDRRRRDGVGYLKLPIAAIGLGVVNVVLVAIALMWTWYSIAATQPYSAP